MEENRRNFMTAAAVIPAALAAASFVGSANAAEMGQSPVKPIRVLLLNPNSSEDFSKIILKEAKRVASPHVEFVSTPSNFGPKYIGTEVSIAVASHALVATMADILKGGEHFDAAIIAGFGSSGSEALQEMAPFPVISLFDASVAAALLYGGKFSIITGGDRWLPLLKKRVEQAGLTSRVASIRIIPLTGAQVAADQSKAIDMLAALSERCATEDGASCVIHGGAAMAGLAALMNKRVSVPLLDNVTVAVAMAETLARAVPQAGASKTSLPPSIDSAGLTDNLSAFLKKPPR